MRSVLCVPSTKDAQSEALLPIGKVSEILGVSVHTLRRWDAKGHLTPIRTPTGQRRYRAADVEALVHPEPPADATDAA